ncbi:MAG TPA: transcription termination factor NusA [Chlamydiales bacterium]|nr:transcription termination factor NusA [Chlamydiales bacterium]
MNKDLIAIFEYLEKEKGIKREVIIDAIKDSLRIAARKSVKEVGEVDVHLDPKTGEIDVFVQKEIVDKVQNPTEEISLEEARELAEDCEIGELLEISITPHDFGRIAAQTARQVISQKLRGAERDVIYEEYRHRIHEIISGKVKRFLRGRTMIVDLGKVEAIMPDREYPREERYNVGDRVQALLLDVRDTDAGGAEVILSRSAPEFVKELFIQEVPELSDEIITIEKIVREGGYRTKMLVRSSDPKIDPVGTCVGVRGTRIKNIIRELNNEKIDVIPYSEDPIQILQNTVDPIEIKRIKSTNDKISIIVGDEDYPIVIGKRGMNARLIAQLLNVEFDVQKMSEHQKLISVQLKEIAETNDPVLDEPLELQNLNSLIYESLISAGYDTIRKIIEATPEEITFSAPGVNYLDLADKIIEKTSK